VCGCFRSEVKKKLSEISGIPSFDLFRFIVHLLAPSFVSALSLNRECVSKTACLVVGAIGGMRANGCD
jgi:hypothetical protein